MVLTTSAGQWLYLIGDTVKFTSKHPYKFVITGRTKHFINAFGEELIVDNAEKGLAKACAETGAQVLEYSAAPVFMDANAKCRHQWLIEFAQMPDDVTRFARILDDTLKEINSDYEAKRQNNLALQPLEVIVARKGLFHDWLAKKGKLGGQQLGHVFVVHVLGLLEERDNPKQRHRAEDAQVCQYQRGDDTSRHNDFGQWRHQPPRHIGRQHVVMAVEM